MGWRQLLDLSGQHQKLITKWVTAHDGALFQKHFHNRGSIGGCAVCAVAPSCSLTRRASKTAFR